MLSEIDHLTLLSLLALVTQLIVILGVILRVILTRHPPGSAFAWILLTIVLPYVGFLLYLILGERPIGRIRARLLNAGNASPHSFSHLDLPLPQAIHHYRSLIQLACQIANQPLTTGNALSLKHSGTVSIQSILDDISLAKHSIEMEFYIWENGGHIEKITQALFEARQRDVQVFLLVDDFGSKNFLKSQLKKDMEAAGMHIASAMPMRFLRMFGLQRADIRLHRKTVIIDQAVAYTGSFNMIDPRGYQASQKVGQWIDAMVRIEGPSVLSLRNMWAQDWLLQPDKLQSVNAIKSTLTNYPNIGQGFVVTVPSSPSATVDTSLLLLLDAINRAEHSVTITTPYFVPNETVIHAILSAALRGVQVRLIVPAKADSRAVNWAMRRYFDDLLNAGVQILMFHGGLLHTKSIAVDDEFALFGTLNIDNRSMHLNFELMLLIFDRPFVNELLTLQQEYIHHSSALNPTTWRKRPLSERMKEGAYYLVAPLL